MNENGSRDVDDLLRLFARKLAPDVVHLDLAVAELLLRTGENEARPYLPRPTLATGLTDVRAGDHPWGPGVPAQEALARLMLVHLDESLATRQAHESGWWSYDGGLFDPLPPWELPRGR